MSTVPIPGTPRSFTDLDLPAAQEGETSKPALVPQRPSEDELRAAIAEAYEKGGEADTVLVPAVLTTEDKIMLVKCLEAGIQKGKVMPYQALAISNKLCLFVPGWVKRQAEHYRESMRSEGERES